MAKLAVIDSQMTRAVCEVLGATEYPGLTASELRSILWEVKLSLDEGRQLRHGRAGANRWVSSASTSNHLRVFCTTPTANPLENLVFAAVRAPLTLPTFAIVGRQSHGVATPRAPPPGRGFKERLFAAHGAHLSSHCNCTVLVCMCVWKR